MASNKKKLDEKHLKMLREMVALPHNKQCLDCHQRGPTYVNMTIGSYVCTACSGLLRGLNPPHRVKSISMASFTLDEIEFIKCHGNDYCRKVWLGLYDSRLSSQTEGRDESKVKDFMAQKYERKRYYVAPTDSMKDEAKRMNESAISTKAPGTKPLKSLLGDNTPKLHVATQDEGVTVQVAVNPFEDVPAPAVSSTPSFSSDLFEDHSVDSQPIGNTGASEPMGGMLGAHDVLGVPPASFQQAAGQPPASQSQPAPFKPAPIIQEQKAPVSATPPPIGSTPQSPGNQSIQSSKSSGSTAMDLLGDLGGDPFASSAPQTHPQSGGGFADFGNFGNTATNSQPQPFSQGATLQPTGSSSQSSSQNGFMSAPAPVAQAPSAGGGGDKYSNLSDLFSVASSAEETQPTVTAVNWAGGSGGVNWGGESNSTNTSGGLNWNSSSAQPAAGSTGFGWGGSSASTSSVSWGGAPAPAQSNGLGAPGNPFLAGNGGIGKDCDKAMMKQSIATMFPKVANPFGGTSNTSLSSQSSMGLGGVSQTPSANPFGGQPVASTGGFGAFGAQNTAVSQNAGFGQFGGAPASTAGAGFGQFGTPASVGGGFGQFGAVQNGSISANTTAAGFGGAQTNVSSGFGAQQGFPGAQTGFGGQAQQPAGFGAQQQAFGTMPGAGFGGQQGQGFGQQQAGFGGQPAQMQGFGGAQAGGSWGQMPASTGNVNPFMSTAQQFSAAPKTGATNPFL